MKKILAILQNQWFKNPEQAQAIFDRYPEARNKLIRDFLFMGCLTGRRLTAALGERLCDHITWEEASPKIGDYSASRFAADPAHIRAAIEKHRPEVIVSFGKIAGDAVRELNYAGLTIFYAPHPADRGRDPMPALRSIGEQLRQTIEGRSSYGIETESERSDFA